MGLVEDFIPGTMFDNSVVQVRLLRGITVLICSEALENNVLDVLAT